MKQKITCEELHNKLNGEMEIRCKGRRGEGRFGDSSLRSQKNIQHGTHDELHF
jgi:hypothetical protein